MWFDNYANVVRLARWLASEQEFTVSELLAYLEKPWKWTEEWNQLNK